MRGVLWLLATQGFLGAFDTVYYHEWKARLPARNPGTGLELRLHAARDFVYAIVFATLPWLAWRGAWAAVLAGLLLFEIVVTILDFVAEDTVRRPFGGVLPGERATHTIMAVVYGAMLGHLVPVLIAWWADPTGLAFEPADGPPALRGLLTAMGLGVLLSGIRDLGASLGGTRSFFAWPWPRPRDSTGEAEP